MSKKLALILNGKATHTDDVAVEVFANAMRRKLARKRADGREGWEGLDPERLARMLVEHIEKGDPVDVANFAMFIGSLNLPRARVRAALREGLQDWICDSVRPTVIR